MKTSLVWTPFAAHLTWTWSQQVRELLLIAGMDEVVNTLTQQLQLSETNRNWEFMSSFIDASFKKKLPELNKKYVYFVCGVLLLLAAL